MGTANDLHLGSQNFGRDILLNFARIVRNLNGPSDSQGQNSIQRTMLTTMRPQSWESIQLSHSSPSRKFRTVQNISFRFDVDGNYPSLYVLLAKPMAQPSAIHCHTAHVNMGNRWCLSIVFVSDSDVRRLGYGN